jgi:two-component system, cell cycle sensor histidine kinase and response regulator CckA
MDDEVLAKIFDPFFTTKGAEKGTGLGLPTVATIVRDSGGFVEVESAPGRGAHFKVFLRRVAAEPIPAPGRTADPAPAPQGAGATVLVAEDEDMIRTLVADILSAHGYQVIETSDAAEALARGHAHEGEIHLLISDVVMPRMSGVDLARRLQGTRPGLPVLFISGYTGDALDRGGGIPKDAEVLRKPFTPGALLERVGEMVRRGAEPDPP